LDLPLLLLPGLLDHVVSLRLLLLLLDVQLQVIDFLQGVNARGEYLLNLIFITPFADGDIVGALLGILNLLPCLHLLLLKEGDTVGKKLRIVVESIGF
jgi:hypothetical protein